MVINLFLKDMRHSGITHRWRFYFIQQFKLCLFDEGRKHSWKHHVKLYSFYNEYVT